MLTAQETSSAQLTGLKLPNLHQNPSFSLSFSDKVKIAEDLICAQPDLEYLALFSVLDKFLGEDRGRVMTRLFKENVESLTVDLEFGVNKLDASQIGSDTVPVPLLLKAMQDSAENMRKMAAYLLGESGRDAVVPLVDHLRFGIPFPHSGLPLVALARVGPGAAEALPHILAVSKRCVPKYVEYAIERIDPGKTKTVQALVELMDSRSGETREHAAKMLGNIAQTAGPAKGRLRESLNDPDADVRKASAYALSAIGWFEKEDPLKTAPLASTLCLFRQEACCGSQ